MSNLYLNRAGITLVALAITIIILLILAGIAISLSIGQRGILRKAEEAGRNYQEAAKREDEQLSNFLKETDGIMDGIEGESKPLPENALVNKVEIGDYVAYDPTLGVTDTSKLTYTSEIGTGMEHGNGYSQQKYTATSNTKWRVLEKDELTGEVILISEAPINTDSGLGFGMYGPIGYLYYEQELNEICKIYGYGKGANTSKTFEYEIGDILDETEEKVKGWKKGRITGSGARSITAEDINKITNYNPSTFTFGYEGITYKYGEEYAHMVFYPTTTTSSGVSISAMERTDKWTAYMYQGLQYLTDTTSPMYQMLFGSGNDLIYWIASRCVASYYTFTGFGIYAVNGGSVLCASLCDGNLSSINAQLGIGGVRPIVYLNSNIKTNTKNESGAWIISE